VGRRCARRELRVASQRPRIIHAEVACGSLGEGAPVATAKKAPFARRTLKMKHSELALSDAELLAEMPRCLMEDPLWTDAITSAR